MVSKFTQIEDKESKMSDVSADRMYKKGQSEQSIEQHKLDLIAWELMEIGEHLLDPDGLDKGHIQECLDYCYNVNSLTDEQFVKAFVMDGKVEMYKWEYTEDLSIHDLLFGHSAVSALAAEEEENEED